MVGEVGWGGREGGGARAARGLQGGPRPPAVRSPPLILPPTLTPHPAGPAAQQRGWVYFSEVKFIPAQDMRTMDALWRAASANKFGYRCVGVGGGGGARLGGGV